MRSVIGTNPVTRAAAAFLVGGLAVLIVHQPVVGLLHGSVPRPLCRTICEPHSRGGFRCSCH